MTQDQIHGLSGSDYSNGVNGLDAWAQEGIVGRGILIDYLSFAEENGIIYDCTAAHHIHTSDLSSILETTNTIPEVGDILFIRTGFVKGYKELTLEQREHYSRKPTYPGVVQSKETAEWLWEKQFAAVAADNPAFECARRWASKATCCATDVL